MLIERVPLRILCCLLLCMSVFIDAMETPVAAPADKLRQDAESGNAEAQYQLGEKIYRERGTDFIEVSKSWFKKAAAKNHPMALHRLGDMAHNWGNNELAINEYRKAAEQGYIFSHFELARLLGKNGLKFLPEEIYHLKAVLTCSAPQSSSEAAITQVVAKTKAHAAYRLAEIFASETDQTELSPGLVEEYCRVALEHDKAYDKARLKLAELLLRKSPVKRDYVKALLSEANETFAPAQCLLADMERDDGNYEKAIQYYGRAVGSAHAQYEQAILLEKHTKGNEKNVLALFCQSAKQGHAKAIERLHLLAENNPEVLCLLARLCRDGEVVPKNETRAVGFYMRSFLAKYAPAVKELEDMAKNSAEAASGMAQLYMGKHIKIGTTGKSHEDFAAQWFDCAARLGNKEALAQLKILGDGGNRRAIENLVLYFSQNARQSEHYREQTRYWSTKFTDSFVASRRAQPSQNQEP